MKRAEVQLPEPLYEEIEGLAKRLEMSVPEVLRKAAEQLVERQAEPEPRPNRDWFFPEGRHLGAFLAPAGDWRVLSNEAAGE